MQSLRPPNHPLILNAMNYSRLLGPLALLSLLVSPNATIQSVRAEIPAHMIQLKRSNKCPKCDLRGADLAGAKLTGADLSGANLSNASLKGASLSGADLSGAILVNADLGGARLVTANLSNANLSGIKRSQLGWNAFSGSINFNSANLFNAKFVDADVSMCDFRNANLVNADFRGANLRNANLQGATILNADFRGANLNTTIMPDGSTR
jgi:uncharacterized protein YjbI with pentapeptide repeats